MATGRQERKFTDEEAERFAALMAGFDTGNPSESEAMGKVRALRRMVAAKTLPDGTPLRIVDAWELPEIRVAIDTQLQPARAALEVVREVQVVNEGCQCEPWPLQMFWFFVGLIAWIVSGIFWTIREVWKVVVWACIFLAVRRMLRKVCRNG
jgi:hypothetical protein